MTCKQMLDAWLNFWFKPEAPTAVALFRIAFGLLALQSALFHLGPDILVWLGPNGPEPVRNTKIWFWSGEPRFDMLLAFPQTDQVVLVFWYCYIFFLVMLIIGFFSRTSSIMVFLALTTMHNHQPYNLNGGDSMTHLFSAYLMFANCGGAISVDRLIKRWLTPTFGEASRPVPCAPVGQRLIAVQLAVAYFTTFCWKISGKQWLDGTAVYYAVRLEDLQRWRLPLLYDNLWFCKLLSWYTLAIEFAMGPLVWIKDWRYWILAGMAILHLGIDAAVNLPVFEWMFMTGFLCFIYPEDLEKLMNWIKARVELGFGPACVLAYNPISVSQTSWASVIEGLDVFGRLSIQRKEGIAALEADVPEGRLTGLSLFAWLTCRLPLLWALYPIFGFPFQRLRKHKQPEEPCFAESGKSCER